MNILHALAVRRAAHAVACFEYGADVQGIDLDRDDAPGVTFGGGSSAYLSITVDDPRSRERALGEKEVRITLAASLSCGRLPAAADCPAPAEELARAREIVWYLAGGWDEDNTDTAAREGVDAVAEAYLCLLVVETERMLDRRWPQIAALADELLKRHALEERQIRQIIVRSLLASPVSEPILTRP